MNKFRRILSIITVLTLFLLFSISPVLAEETTGSIDLGAPAEGSVIETVVEIPEAEEPVSETVVEIPEADESVAETVVDIPDADESVVETVVDIPDADESVVETIPESSEYLDSSILNVIVPVSVSITIDPLELAGKGQVYSNTYHIKNYGDTDVLLTFTDIQVIFAEGAPIEPLAQPFDQGLGSKSIFMMLDFGRSDIPPAVITDPNQKKEISIPLSAAQDDMAGDSLVQLDFSGSVNEASALDWHDNDVKIAMNYTLVAVPPPVEEITPSAIEVTPPAIETTPPVEEAAPPAEDAVPPAEEAVPPAEEAVPPAEEAVPPAEEAVPPAEEAVPPAEEAAPPAEEAAPPAEEAAPPAEEAAPPAEEAAPEPSSPPETSQETQESQSEPST